MGLSFANDCHLMYASIFSLCQIANKIIIIIVGALEFGTNVSFPGVDHWWRMRRKFVQKTYIFRHKWYYRYSLPAMVYIGLKYLLFRANSYTGLNLIQFQLRSSFSSNLDVNLIRNEEIFRNKSIKRENNLLDDGFTFLTSRRTHVS